MGVTKWIKSLNLGSSSIHQGLGMVALSSSLPLHSYVTNTQPSPLLTLVYI